MTENVIIFSTSQFDFNAFVDYLDMRSSLILDSNVSIENENSWCFYRPKHSTTQFMITLTEANQYIVSIDRLASVEDYKFFPYLADSVSKFLNGEITDLSPNENIYHHFDNDWMEECIADEIAYLKGTLTILPKYYLSLPIKFASYVSLKDLEKFGVTLHSATPRIYGYIQYMIKQNILLSSSIEELSEEFNNSYQEFEESEFEVDIPQHSSVGRVKSWQLDGEETYESYSKEDVELLLKIANDYNSGKVVDGVVLNDIGTVFQEGIGVDKNLSIAAQWFERAYEKGDHLYAPTNLGDLYRKGGDALNKSLSKALEYYSLSDDPYSWYRIGQAYEEGWTSGPDKEKAFVWYKKAAKAGHHLAIKRLSQK